MWTIQQTLARCSYVSKETVKAGIDLKSKKIMPIHWGTFKLAMHPWNEPAIEVYNESKKKNIDILIPENWEEIKLDFATKRLIFWWK